MNWVDEKSLRHNRIKVEVEPNSEILQYLVERSLVVAWVSKSADDFYWVQFDDEPRHGPFDTLESAKLACEVSRG